MPGAGSVIQRERLEPHQVRLHLAGERGTQAAESATLHDVGRGHLLALMATGLRTGDVNGESNIS